MNSRTTDTDPANTVEHIERALDVISGRWKAAILLALRDGALRYAKLHRKIPRVTSRMLAFQLRALERQGLIVRTVYPVNPPQVEYNLSPAGVELLPLLTMLAVWSRNNRSAETL